MKDVISVLQQGDIQPTPQRIAVAEYALKSKTHPSANQVLSYARKKCPTISRATVYNTMNLLVEKGLLGMQTIKEGGVVFEPNTEKHHHFIDYDTGDIYDIPWDQLEVKGKDKLKDFEIVEFQVIMRGRKKKKGLK
jgi:Fe2+ or Zn2+ uptake regulation protein